MDRAANAAATAAISLRPAPPRAAEIARALAAMDDVGVAIDQPADHPAGRVMNRGREPRCGFGQASVAPSQTILPPATPIARPRPAHNPVGHGGEPRVYPDGIPQTVSAARDRAARLA